ncbi:MAG: arginine--tRNA ligase [Phycisphaerales bacterium]|nr:arginine--tRNA ligase [Phycisphaerales bacterium]
MNATDQTPSTPAADPVEHLRVAVRQAIVAALGTEYADVDPVIRASQNPQFGDFQANFAMALAKSLGRKPRDLATEVAAAIDFGDLADPPEIAGPGFINIRLKPDALARCLEAMDDDALGVTADPDPHAVVIDLCGVKVAKELHVGHLRATIIGDALARIFERRGRLVHRENHLGDWGLPIAMVLHELRASGTNLDTLQLADLNRAYRDAQLSARADPRGLETALRTHAGPHRIIELREQNAGAQDALDAAKATLVRLQGGDPELVRDWQKLIDCTMRSVYEAIDLLNVDLGPENNRGESFYRDRLPDVIDAFARAGLAEEDDGALVVRFPDRERPLVIRKSDGGFLYATTDLAAVRYRVHELNGGRVIYVVDARQRDHFRDVFDAARRIGWDQTPDHRTAELVHIGFGTVLGDDKRPLKTRSGRNVTLRSLLDEAIERGIDAVRERATDERAPTHGLPDAEIARIGRAVGIAAIKYADLSNDLVRDYVFDMDRMVAFEGNTGPYLQYAHARTARILGDSGLDDDAIDDAPLLLREPTEKLLALALLRYGQAVAQVTDSLEPHRVCTYLYDLANAFNAFYQQCPVLKADDDETMRSRLRLCRLVRRVIADGLNILGIEAPDRM